MKKTLWHHHALYCRYFRISCASVCKGMSSACCSSSPICASWMSSFASILRTRSLHHVRRLHSHSVRFPIVSQATVRPHWSDGLNEDQKAASKYLDGPLRVIAGPGSGKTRVCVLRVYCVHHHVILERLCSCTT